MDAIRRPDPRDRAARQRTHRVLCNDRGPHPSRVSAGSLDVWRGWPRVPLRRHGHCSSQPGRQTSLGLARPDAYDHRSERRYWRHRSSSRRAAHCERPRHYRHRLAARRQSRLAYCGWLKDKGYQGASATESWKSAAEVVFETVERSRSLSGTVRWRSSIYRLAGGIRRMRSGRRVRSPRPQRRRAQLLPRDQIGE
jgi:hypothetical protein